MPEGSERIALLGVLAALGVAVGAAVARRARRSVGGESDGTPAIEERTGGTPVGAGSGGEASGSAEPEREASGSAEPESAEPHEYTCTCGREYRTSGAGRHRVYWPADAPESQPVLGDECPECGARLPAEPERTTA